jgi:hypothetical protein
MLQYNLRPVGAVCLLLFGLVIAGVHALDSGEVVALQDMQLEWGQKLGWTGAPSCEWTGISQVQQHGTCCKIVGIFLSFCPRSLHLKEGLRIVLTRERLFLFIIMCIASGSVDETRLPSTILCIFLLTRLKSV